MGKHGKPGEGLSYPAYYLYNSNNVCYGKKGAKRYDQNFGIRNASRNMYQLRSDIGVSEKRCRSWRGRFQIHRVSCLQRTCFVFLYTGLQLRNLTKLVADWAS